MRNFTPLLFPMINIELMENWFFLLVLSMWHIDSLDTHTRLTKCHHIVGTYKGQTLCWYCWIHIIRENFDQTWLELVHSARNLFTSHQVFYYIITMEDINSVKAWIGNWKSLMQFYSAINWKNYTFYTSYAHWYKIQIYLLDQK